MRLSPSLFAAFGLLGLFALNGADAAIFVYQLPNGSRLITDHPMNNAGYKLLHKSQRIEGAGEVAAGRRPGAVVLTPAANPAAYDALIRRAAALYRVDAALVKAIIHAESAYNPQAVSRKGASGLMQLMPDTARRYEVGNLFDPTQNVYGGVRYLKDLLTLFENDLRLTVAAYNAGENAVARYRDIPPYAETKSYVTKVLALHRSYASLRN